MLRRAEEQSHLKHPRIEGRGCLLGEGGGGGSQPGGATSAVCKCIVIAAGKTTDGGRSAWTAGNHAHACSPSDVLFVPAGKTSGRLQHAKLLQKNPCQSSIQWCADKT